MSCSEAPARQTGAIALGTSLVLLVLIAWIVIAAVRVATGDQRSLGNELHRRESLALAEAGLARALAYLSRNAVVVRSTRPGGWMGSSGARWTACASARIDLPCGDGVRNQHAADWSAFTNAAGLSWSNDTGTAQVHLLARTVDLVAGAAQPMLVEIVAEARGADVGARVVVYQSALIYPLLAAAPEAPLVAAGARLSGDGSLVSRTDGAGAGAALSLWTTADAQLLDTVRTCLPLAATAQGCPVAGSASSAAIENADVLDVDGNRGILRDSRIAPGDLPLRGFGVATSSWRMLRSQSRPIDCAQASVMTAGALWWSEGDCLLPAGAVLGSVTAPLLLVVSNGDLRASGVSINAVVMMLSVDDAPRAVSLQNGSVIVGALLGNGVLRVDGDRYQIRYDAAVMSALQRSEATPLGVAVIPGSWRDFP